MFSSVAQVEGMRLEAERAGHAVLQLQELMQHAFAGANQKLQVMYREIAGLIADASNKPLGHIKEAYMTMQVLGERYGQLHGEVGCNRVGLVQCANTCATLTQQMQHVRRDGNQLRE